MKLKVGFVIASLFFVSTIFATPKTMAGFLMPKREKFVTRASCEGYLHADNNSADTGDVRLQIKNGAVIIQAKTAYSLKSYKEVFEVFDGQKGFIVNGMISDAHVYARLGRVIVNVTALGYNITDREMGAVLSFDVGSETYYGVLRCDEVE